MLILVDGVSIGSRADFIFLPIINKDSETGWGRLQASLHGSLAMSVLGSGKLSRGTRTMMIVAVAPQK